MTVNLNCQQYTLCSYCISHQTAPSTPRPRCTGPALGTGPFHQSVENIQLGSVYYQHRARWNENRRRKKNG